MKIAVSLACLFLLVNCDSNGPGSPVSVDGALIAPNSTDIPILPDQATITVTGRDTNPTEFTVDFKTRESKDVAPLFTIHDLPMGETLMFQIGGSGLDPVVSFPILIDPNFPLELPGVPSGTIDAIIQEAEDTFYIAGVVDRTLAIVTGIVAPVALNCTITRVDLVTRTTPPQSVLVSNINGPFYFNQAGQVVDSGYMADAECSYIIFNVLPGLYRLNFIDNTGQTVANPDIVASGQVVYGYDIP